MEMAVTILKCMAGWLLALVNEDRDDTVYTKLKIIAEPKASWLYSFISMW